MGWTFAAAGLVARWWRPGSRTGILMIVEGLTWFIGNLQGTTLPALVAVGAWLEGINDAVLAHLVLSFPTGRLETLPARLVVGAAYSVVLAVGLVWAMTFDPRTDGWATYLSCPGCGPNALLVDSDPALFATIDLTYRCLGTALGIACAALVARRWMTSSSRTRRALLPTWTLVVVGAVFAGWGLLTTLAPEMSRAPGQPVLWAADLSQLAVPVALLGGLLCARRS